MIFKVKTPALKPGSFGYFQSVVALMNVLMNVLVLVLVNVPVLVHVNESGTFL